MAARFRPIGQATNPLWLRTSVAAHNIISAPYADQIIATLGSLTPAGFRPAAQDHQFDDHSEPVVPSPARI